MHSVVPATPMWGFALAVVVCLLFTPWCPQESWGWTARKRWLSLPAEERPRYAYLENFKLMLHEGKGQGQGPLDTVCPLPPNLTPTQVAADFLAEIKRWVPGWVGTRRAG